MKYSYHFYHLLSLHLAFHNSLLKKNYKSKIGAKVKIEEIYKNMNYFPKTL